MMRQTFLAFRILLLVFFTGACCDGAHYYPSDVTSFNYAYADTTALFDSVYNIENKRKVWSIDRIRINGILISADTNYMRLPLDPLREQSSFVFYYSSKPSDTVVVEHEFEIQYGNCNDYYFKAVSTTFSKSTFSDTSCITDHFGECVSFEAYLQ